MNYKTTIFAPHDRINYGDFLFAIMLEYALKQKDSSVKNVAKHSIVKADYSNIGAFHSKSYQSLTTEIDQKEINSVIVGGGQCLSTNWVTLFSYINPLIHTLSFDARLYKFQLYHKIVRKILGGKSEFPFCVKKSDFSNASLKVIYNSVGSGKITKEIENRLNEADYVAVRDNRSFQNISSKVNNVVIVPDSAIILSDVYALDDSINHKNDYVFFQASLHKYGGDISVTIRELNEILKKTELDIILCPIGTAPGHNDDQLLKKIKKAINNDRVTYIPKPTIKEIAHLIAHSKCYVGTSLHGIITAMSYGVPYIGLNPKQEKLVSYNETWSIEELVKIWPTDSFSGAAIHILSLNKSNLLSEKIQSQTALQKKKYYESFDKIYQIISS